MTLNQAVEIIIEYNYWRTGGIETSRFKPSEITEALNKLITNAKKQSIRSKNRG